MLPAPCNNSLSIVIGEKNSDLFLTCPMPLRCTAMWRYSHLVVKLGNCGNFQKENKKKMHFLKF